MRHKMKISLLVAALMLTVFATSAIAYATEMPAEVGKIDDTKFPSKYKGQEASVTDAIREEYQAQLNMGFNPGKPDSEYVHEWSDGSRGNEMSQNFQGGDSNSLAWSKNHVTIIMVEKPGDKAYTIKNDMLTAYANFGAIITVGPARGNEFKDGNDVYQNFKWGYIKLKDGKYFKAKFFEGQQYTPSENPVPPSEEPSEQPSEKPSEEPSEKPSEQPSEKPSEQPSEKPSEEPSEKPSEQPSEEPSETETSSETEIVSESERPTEPVTPSEPNDDENEEDTAEPIVEIEESKPLLVWCYVIGLVALFLLAAGGVAIYLVIKKSK